MSQRVLLTSVSVLGLVCASAFLLGLPSGRALFDQSERVVTMDAESPSSPISSPVTSLGVSLINTRTPVHGAAASTSTPAAISAPVLTGQCRDWQGRPIAGIVEIFVRTNAGEVATLWAESDDRGAWKASLCAETRALAARIEGVGAPSASNVLEWGPGSHSRELPTLVAPPSHALRVECTDETGRAVPGVSAYWLGNHEREAPLDNGAERAAREFGESSASGVLNLSHIPEQGGFILCCRAGFATACVRVPPFDRVKGSHQDLKVQLVTLEPLEGTAPDIGAGAWEIYQATDRFAAIGSSVSSCWMPESSTDLSPSVSALASEHFTLERTAPGYPLLLAAPSNYGDLQLISKFDPIAGRYTKWEPALETTLELENSGRELGLEGAGQLRMVWKSGDAVVDHTVRLSSEFDLSNPGGDIRTHVVFVDCAVDVELRSGVVVHGRASTKLGPGVNRLRLERHAEPEHLELHVQALDEARGIRGATVRIHGGPDIQLQTSGLRTDESGIVRVQASTDQPLWAQVLPGSGQGGSEPIALGRGFGSLDHPRRVELLVEEKSATLHVRLPPAPHTRSDQLYRVALSSMVDGPPQTAALSLSRANRRTDLAPWEAAAGLIEDSEVITFPELRPGAYVVYGVPASEALGDRLILTTAVRSSPLSRHSLVELAVGQEATIELPLAESLEVMLRVEVEEIVGAPGQIALQPVGCSSLGLSPIPAAAPLPARPLGNGCYSVMAPAEGYYLVHIVGVGDVPSTHCVEIRRDRVALVPRTRRVQVGLERGMRSSNEPIFLSVFCMSFSEAGHAIPSLTSGAAASFQLDPDSDQIVLRNVDPYAQLRLQFRQGDWVCDRIISPTFPAAGDEASLHVQVRVPLP